MTVERISWLISTKEWCRTSASNLQPLNYQSDTHPTALPGLVNSDKRGLCVIMTIPILHKFQPCCSITTGKICFSGIWLYVQTASHSWSNRLHCRQSDQNIIFVFGQYKLTLVLLSQGRHCLRKQCGFRSDGFWRSHLIRIYSVFHSVCEFIRTNNIELSDWLTVRIGVANLIYSAG